MLTRAAKAAHVRTYHTQHTPTPTPNTQLPYRGPGHRACMYRITIADPACMPFPTTRTWHPYLGTRLIPTPAKRPSTKFGLPDRPCMGGWGKDSFTVSGQIDGWEAEERGLDHSTPYDTLLQNRTGFHHHHLLSSTMKLGTIAPLSPPPSSCRNTKLESCLDLYHL